MAGWPVARVGAAAGGSAGSTHGQGADSRSPALLASAGTLPLWAVWLLLARELLISGWRAQASDGAPASSGGKAKTILQFLSLLMLLWPQSWLGPSLARWIGWWLFWPSLLLAMSSAVGYLRPRSELRHR